MGRDARGLDREVTGVFELAWVDTSAQYESALVYPMPPIVVELVGALRHHLGMGALPEFQLAPHLTVLSLGRLDGAQLLTLWHCLHAYRQETVAVRLHEFGTFGAEGRITNIHIRIAPSPELLALHSRVLQACMRFPWFVPGPYVGPGYTPHVSILDHLEVQPDACQLPEPTWTVGQQLRLEHLHMTAKPLVAMDARGAADVPASSHDLYRQIGIYKGRDPIAIGELPSSKNLHAHAETNSPPVSMLV